MKSRPVRALYDYWNTRRGARAAPERDEIEPGGIRSILADTFILAIDESRGHPFRIAGTRVCAAFDRELKGEPFLGLWSSESRAAMRDLVLIVAQEAIGTVAGAHALNAEGAMLDLELLLLPLAYRGRTDVRMLGALAPVRAPYWLGISALDWLDLGAFRYLGPQAEPEQEPQRRILQRRFRHGFVVYDGGRQGP